MYQVEHHYKILCHLLKSSSSKFFNDPISVGIVPVKVLLTDN